MFFLLIKLIQRLYCIIRKITGQLHGVKEVGQTDQQQPSLGIAIAIAIAIHNVPEGLSVAFPVYYATGSRKKALEWSLLSGFAEPVGAIIAYIILLPILNDIIFGILYTVIAENHGIYILDELLPTAREYGEHRLSVYGLIAGMMVMSVSLIVLI